MDRAPSIVPGINILVSRSFSVTRSFRCLPTILQYFRLPDLWCCGRHFVPNNSTHPSCQLRIHLQIENFTTTAPRRRVYPFRLQRPRSATNGFYCTGCTPTASDEDGANKSANKSGREDSVSSDNALPPSTFNYPQQLVRLDVAGWAGVGKAFV